MAFCEDYSPSYLGIIKYASYIHVAHFALFLRVQKKLSKWCARERESKNPLKETKRKELKSAEESRERQ
jgi:hypothetical protein